MRQRPACEQTSRSDWPGAPTQVIPINPLPEARRPGGGTHSNTISAVSRSRSTATMRPSGAANGNGPSGESEIEVCAIEVPRPNAGEVHGFRIAGISSGCGGLAKQVSFAWQIRNRVDSDPYDVPARSGGRRWNEGRNHLDVKFAINIRNNIMNRVPELCGRSAVSP